MSVAFGTVHGRRRVVETSAIYRLRSARGVWLSSPVGSDAASFMAAARPRSAFAHSRSMSRRQRARSNVYLGVLPQNIGHSRPHQCSVPGLTSRCAGYRRWPRSRRFASASPSGANSRPSLSTTIRWSPAVSSSRASWPTRARCGLRSTRATTACVRRAFSANSSWLISATARAGHDLRNPCPRSTSGTTCDRPSHRRMAPYARSESAGSKRTSRPRQRRTRRPQLCRPCVYSPTR